MTPEQVDRTIPDVVEIPPSEKDEGRERAETPDRERPRLDPLKLFRARWEYLKPGLEFLAEH